MASPQTAVQKSRKRGYAAFLVCGICVALNILAYLPAQTFLEAEAIEFTTTLLLLVIFIIAGFIGVVSAIKNRGDAGLLVLLLLTFAFALTTNYWGSWALKIRIGLQLSYVILVLTLGTVRLLAVERQPR